MNSLKIVFMGTPAFAVPSLQCLADSRHQVVAVVTAPDQEAGRGLHMKLSEVKKAALERNIPVLQPLKLKDPEFISILQSFQADLFVVVAFRMLPEVVWNMPPNGTINLHASLLPQYRGAAPINRAIMNGEKETGVTIFFLQHEIDTGQIIRQQKMLIGDDENAGQLHDRMMLDGAQLLLESVNAIADGTVSAIDQSELVVSTTTLHHAPKIFREDMEIDFSVNCQAVHNHVRGLSPYPGAWTNFEGKLFKIFEGKPHHDGANHVGEIESDGKNYLRFGCSDGWYEALTIQAEGKKKMLFKEFAKGWRKD